MALKFAEVVKREREKGEENGSISGWGEKFLKEFLTRKFFLIKKLMLEKFC